MPEQGAALRTSCRPSSCRGSDENTQQHTGCVQETAAKQGANTCARHPGRVKAATVENPSCHKHDLRSACNTKPPQPKSGPSCIRRVGHRPCNNHRKASSLPSKQAATSCKVDTRLCHACVCWHALCHACVSTCAGRDGQW